MPVQCTVTVAPRVTAAPVPLVMTVFSTPGETWIGADMIYLNVENVK